MAWDSLFGFALVAALLTCLASGVLHLTFRVAGAQLRAAGPVAQRLASASVLALPPVTGFGLAAVLATQSWLRAGYDHCLTHDDGHRHLCVVHGHGWSENLPALVLACVWLLPPAMALGRYLHARSNTNRAMSALRQVGTPLQQGNHPLLLVPAAASFCFTIGIQRPQVVVSTSAWQSLDALQRQVVLAHESAHIAHRDLLWAPLLAVLARLGLPGVHHRVLALWRSSTERSCDAHAAEQVGDPLVVASALLRLARAPSGLTTAFDFAGSDVDERIASLLSATVARPTPRWLTWLPACLVAFVLLAGTLRATWLHHHLETWLGGP